MYVLIRNCVVREFNMTKNMHDSFNTAPALISGLKIPNHCSFQGRCLLHQGGHRLDCCSSCLFARVTTDLRDNASIAWQGSGHLYFFTVKFESWNSGLLARQGVVSS